VFEWRPARIKIQIFPYDGDVTAKHITKWLEALASTGDILPFHCNGSGEFGYIPTFQKHQEIKNPSKWRFAEVPEGLLRIQENELSPTPVLPQEGVSPTLREKEKEKSIGNREKESIDKSPYGEFQNVFLSGEEFEKLTDKFGEVTKNEKIESLSRGIASKGYKYKSHYATLLNWDRKNNGGSNGRISGQVAANRESQSKPGTSNYPGLKIIEGGGEP
jgi:hypothetical protein